LDSPTQAADEQAILRIAKELVEELKIPSFKPVSVSWAEDVPWTLPDSENILPQMTGIVKREVPTGWCVFTWDRVLLPAGMKGKLDPEEWRPLLASSLIYEAKMRIKRYLGLVFVSTPVIIDALGWLELFAVSTPASGIPVILLILDIAGVFAALILSGLLARWLSRGLRLGADTLAAEHVGKELLMGVLEKMNALGLVDMYAGSTWNVFSTLSTYPFSSELMSGRPTLTERIRNLNQNPIIWSPDLGSLRKT
jgi:hypothetical protein